MKKIVIFQILCISLYGILFAAGNKEKVDVSISPAPIIMRIGHAQPVTHPRHLSLLKFKELVNQRTGGVLAVEIFPAGQLGDEATMLEATKLGILQGTRGGLFELVAPRLLIYTLPFLFDSLDSIEKVTNGIIGDRIAAEAELYGLLVLTTGDAGGFRQFTNNVRPIVNPEDCLGLKFRVPDVKTIIKTLEAYGIEPISIPYAETYTALKTGKVDGQENPIINIEGMKFYEVQKYLTVIDYQFHPDPFIVNPIWYRSLSMEHRITLKECAIESMKFNNQLVRTEAVKAMEILKNAMLVTELSTDQRLAFKNKAKDVYNFFIEEGITTQDEIDEIRATIRHPSVVGYETKR